MTLTHALTLLHHPLRHLDRRTSYRVSPTVLNVRADALRVGDRIDGKGTVADVRAVTPIKGHPLVFTYDALGLSLGVYEGDEFVPIRLGAS